MTGVTPSGGAVATATAVTISGNGSAAGATVAFGGIAATDVVVVSANQITATSPPEAAGVVDVTVTQGAETSPTNAADEFTYGGPSVSGVFPTAGPLQGGEAVAIAGSGFVSGSTVSFGGVASPSVTVNSDTLITAVAPAAATGTVDITVTTPVATSTASAADQFTTDAAPSVTSISPNGGPHAGGTVVTITGTGFVAGASVSFGTIAATSVTVISPTSISATSPALYADAVGVSVTTPGGTSAPSVADLFAYGSPSIQSVEPDAGDVAGGTFVAITGSGFATGATVNFGAVAATDVTVLSGNRLTAVAPAGSAGSLDVTVTTAAGTSSATTTDLFAYGVPTVTGLTPSAGPSAGGTVTTITGTGFVPDATVSFGATQATSVDVESGTKIVTVTPPGSGTESVVVHTPAGDSVPDANSAFLFGGATVTSITPDAGPAAGGTVVAITGTEFTSDSTVSFGNTPAASVTYISPTSMLATAPALSTGSFDVTVTNDIATSPTSLADLFAAGAPAVTSITPDGGPGAGGNTVTVTGSGFVPDATVDFGTAPGSDVNVVSGTKLTVTAPAYVNVAVNVTVANSDGTSADVPADVYTYGAPTVNSINPSSGPLSGGTSVTVTGTNFTPDSTVTFGLESAATVTVQSSTSLVVISPSAAAGAYDIRVQTPGGLSAATPADQFTYDSQLEISCAAPPADTATTVCPGIDLPTTALNGSWQTAQAPANTMYITDNRGDASAGWSVSAYMVPTPTNPNPWCSGVAAFCNATAGSDSAHADAKIPSSYLTIGNINCSAMSGNPSQDPQGGVTATFPQADGAVGLCTAQAGQSAGTFKLGATFSLSIPPWVYAGQYQATVEYLAM